METFPLKYGQNGVPRAAPPLPWAQEGDQAAGESGPCPAAGDAGIAKASMEIGTAHVCPSLRTKHPQERGKRRAQP